MTVSSFEIDYKRDICWHAYISGDTISKFGYYRTQYPNLATIGVEGFRKLIAMLIGVAQGL